MSYRNHIVFREYAELVEVQLERFIEEEGLPVQVSAVCPHMQVLMLEFAAGLCGCV